MPDYDKKTIADLLDGKLGWTELHEMMSNEGKETSQIIGLQGALWSEYLGTEEHMQYMAFPRLLALAERAWSPAVAPVAEQAGLDEFLARVRGHEPLLRDVLGVRYHQRVFRHPTNNGRGRAGGGGSGCCAIQ